MIKILQKKIFYSLNEIIFSLNKIYKQCYNIFAFYYFSLQITIIFVIRISTVLFYSNNNIKRSKLCVYFYQERDQILLKDEKSAKNKEKVQERLKQMVFADVSCDFAIKKLLNQKDILISLLDCFLDLQFYENKIEIQSKSLYKYQALHQKNEKNLIQNKLDFRCICSIDENTKYDIAIEMQRDRQTYFVAREQQYISKMLSNQVFQGEHQKYHKMPQTILLIFTRYKLFYEKGLDIMSEYTIQQMIRCEDQTLELPGCKMKWKVIQFQDYYINKQRSPDLKYQWIEFFNICHLQTIIPENINQIIKKAYRLMEIKKFNTEEDTLLWQQMQDIYFENYYDEEEEQIDFKQEAQKVHEIFIKYKEEAHKKEEMYQAREEQFIVEKKAREAELIEEKKAIEQKSKEEKDTREKQFQIEKEEAIKNYNNIINSKQLKINLKDMKKIQTLGMVITREYLIQKGYVQQNIQEYILNQLDDDYE